MSKIVVVPLSLLVDTVLQRSIDAFSKLNISKFKIFRHWSSLNKLFERYRIGELTSEQIKNDIARLFPEGDFAHGKFEAAWNVQVLVTEKTRAHFSALESLAKQGVEVYITSTTNELHHQFIEAQYGKKIPGIPYFSYQEHKFGNQLLIGLMATLKSKYPHLKQEEVVVLYAKPGDAPLANWGPLGWAFAFFQRFAHRQAIHYVAGLEKQAATSKAFELSPCDFSKENAITQVLQENGWLNGSILDQAPPNLISRHHPRYSLRKNPKPPERFSSEQSFSPKRCQK